MKMFIFVSAILLFSSACFAEENSENTYRHQNDKEFNLEKLTGYIDDNNFSFRENFYSRKNYEWIEEKKDRLKRGNEEDPVDFFENFIDFSLGVDFPKEKRSKIIDNRRNLEKTIKSLGKLFENGTITEGDYIFTLSFESQRSFEQTSWVLTDKEFEILFQFKKEEIPDAFNFFSASLGQ